MRGVDHQQADMYSYLSPEARVRADHPLRAIRTMADQALSNMTERFDGMYAKTGRPSIPPEKLLRAQLVQMLYSVRSERLLMEEIDYSMLFRWFVGMNLDEPVWDVTVFTKNRDQIGPVPLLGAEQALADGGDRLQHVVPVVCGHKPGRAGMGRHGIHQKPGPIVDRKSTRLNS